MNDLSQAAPLLAPVGCVVGLICIGVALRSARRNGLVDDLPTSKTTGVFIGLVELKGSAESECPLTSYLAGQPCIYYAWSIEEHWSRTVVETYVDNNGKTQTRTRHESGWKTVAQGGDMQAFYLKDDCGVIRILPQGAKLEPQTFLHETCGRGDPLYYGKGPAAAIANSDHERQFLETGIILHVPLYLVGQARERDDIVAAEIAHDKNAPLFLISTRSEKQVSSGYGWGKWGWGFVGLLGSVGGFLVIGQTPAGPNVILLGAVGLAYLFAVGLGWVWMVFNSLIDLRQRVHQGWSQVDVQLKRRYDLITNVVNTIKGLRDYEKNLQTELAQLRAQSGATPPGHPGPDYQACSKVLIALRERYPEIVAQTGFLELQKTLVDTEQRIALARGYFNEIATYYNTRLEILPDRYIAGIVRMQPRALMAANEFERAPVDVKMA